MTREEAREIVFNKMKNFEGKECQGLVDAIEALGLIKFDEATRIWYESENSDIWGTVVISEFCGELQFWVCGRHRFTLKKENV